MSVFRVVAALSLLVFVSAGTGCLSWPGPSGDPRVEKLFGGAEGYELIAIPALANIRAYRVQSNIPSSAAAPAPSAPKLASDPKEIGGYEVISTAASPGDEALRELSRILRSSDTYAWDSAKGCKFDPGVALRFSGARTTLDVLFCFSCKELAVYKDGKPVGHEDFDARAGELAALVQQWFPELNLK